MGPSICTLTFFRSRAFSGNVSLIFSSVFSVFSLSGTPIETLGFLDWLIHFSYFFLLFSSSDFLLCFLEISLTLSSRLFLGSFISAIIFLMCKSHLCSLWILFFKNSILFLFSLYNVLYYPSEESNDSKWLEIFFSLPTFSSFKLLPPLSVCFLYIYLTLEAFFIYHLIFARLRNKSQRANWELRLRLIDFEAGYAEIWGDCLLGNLSGGLWA